MQIDTKTRCPSLEPIELDGTALTHVHITHTLVCRKERLSHSGLGLPSLKPGKAG